MILASNAELHGRIAELEKALAVAHAQGSSAPHELLTNTLLFSPRDPKTTNTTDREAGTSKKGPEEDGESDTSVRAVKRRKSGKHKEHRIHRRQDGDIDSSLEDAGIKSEDREARDSKRTGSCHLDDRLEASLGTLTITQNGEARFVGNAAASSHLTESEGAGRQHPRYSAENQIQPARFAYQGAEAELGDFPFAMSITSSQESLSLHQLWQKLPAWDTDPLQGFNASNLFPQDFVRQHRMMGNRIAEGGMDMVKAYWENVDWMYNVVPVSDLVGSAGFCPGHAYGYVHNQRVIFDSDYLPSVYQAAELPTPHKLAVVYLVMALGVMFDLERREPRTYK